MKLFEIVSGTLNLCKLKIKRKRKIKASSNRPLATVFYGGRVLIELKFSTMYNTESCASFNVRFYVVFNTNKSVTEACSEKELNYNSKYIYV